MNKQQQQSSTHRAGVQKGHRAEAGLSCASASSKTAYVEASQHYAATPAAITEPDWKVYCDCRLKSFLSGR